LEAVLRKNSFKKLKRARLQILYGELGRAETPLLGSGWAAGVGAVPVKVSLSAAFNATAEPTSAMETIDNLLILPSVAW
jgi:hypothetical protein